MPTIKAWRSRAPSRFFQKCTQWVGKKRREIVHKSVKCDHKSSRCSHTVTKNRSDFAERERAMQEAPHPNKLRMLLAIAGLNQREAAREAGIPEGTLRHYVAGEFPACEPDSDSCARIH